MNSKNLFQVLLLSAALLLPYRYAPAAIDAQDQSPTVPPVNQLKAAVHLILLGDTTNLNIENEIKDLESLGENILPILVSVKNDQSLPMKARWTSIMALAKMGGTRYETELTSGLDDKDWFVRSACAKALGYIKSASALKKLHDVLKNDSSMAVRTSAADSIALIGDKVSLPVLKEVLNQKNNFRMGRGLWIRDHIVKAIASLGGKNEVQFLYGLMKEEKNSELFYSLHLSLRELTGLNPRLEPPYTQEAVIKEWDKLLSKN